MASANVGDGLVGPGGRVKKGRTLGALFVVLALTFAAAYYVPLHRTHVRLLSEYAALSERVGGAEQELVRTRAELAAMTKSRDALSARVKADDATASQHDEQLARVGKELRDRLGSSSVLSVDKKPDRVVVHVAPSALKSVHDRIEVSQDAGRALCDVVLAVVPSPFSVAVVARGAGPKAKSPWDSAAERAGAIARVLGDQCKLPGARLSAVARASTDGDGALDVEIGEKEP